jgi:hypothetical protein
MDFIFNIPTIQFTLDINWMVLVMQMVEQVVRVFG